MALFRSFQEVTPLFRILDDVALTAARRSRFPSATPSIRAFQPRFDIREVKDSYELHGELPGIAQENVSLQWDDGQTLTVKGRTERTQSESTPTPTQTPIKNATAHRATVEDAPEDLTPATSTAEVTPSTTSQVSKTEPDNKPRYWVAERSIGEFSRTWKFPGRLDQDNVRASLKDGILSIVVPKAKVTPPKKITIE